MIARLAIFGATGDLAARYLFPALAAMHAAGRLPERFSIIGAARAPLTDDAFRRQIGEALDQHAAEVSSVSRERVIASLRYTAADLSDAEDLRGAIGSDDDRSPLAAYLALPPAILGPAIRALAEADMPDGSRIAVEKPFGSNLADARSLNALVTELFGNEAERTIYRVDHVLGMTTVHNLTALRVANPMMDAFWNAAAISQVEVLWEEVIGLEARAGYFDAAGALKDVMQNHMIQVLALVAMEPPASLGTDDLRDAKVRALEAVRGPTVEMMAERTRRARYAAGTLAMSSGSRDRTVPAYVAEAGVDPARETETLAEVVVEVDTPRWRGTPFVLRGGKALAERRKGVFIRFRSRPDGEGSTMWIGIDGPDDIRLRLTGASSGDGMITAPVVLTAPPPVAELPPYGNVLADLLTGGSRLAVRGDEAEEAWRIVMPVLEAWSTGLVPMEEYPAGAPGLPPRA